MAESEATMVAEAAFSYPWLRVRPMCSSFEYRIDIEISKEYKGDQIILNSVLILSFQWWYTLP